MFHVKHGYREVLASLGVDPTTTRVSRLYAYEALLASLAVPRGMVAKGDADRLRDRHVVDALRAVDLLRGTADAADLGSGAGLPGVPLAIVREDMTWTLVEKRRHRVAFLERVQAELGLSNVQIAAGPASEHGSRFDVVVARAFASASATWEAAEALLRPRGRLLYWSGAGSRPEDDLPTGVTVRLATSPVAGYGSIAIMART